MSRAARRRFLAAPAAIAASPAGVKVDDSRSIERAIGQVADAVNAVVETGRTYVDADLVIGTNRIAHGLGRPAIRVEVIPATANATFAWGFDPAQSTNATPERLAYVEVTGTAMTARLFFS